MPAFPFEELTVAELRRHQSVKWSQYGPEVVPLWVAQMDVRPAPEVVEAVCRAMHDGDTGYPNSSPRYPEALAQFAASRWGWEVAVADSAACADVMSGVRALLAHLAPRGGTVLVPSPAYPPLAGFAAELGCRVVQVPLAPSGALDVAAVEEALVASDAGHPRMILLCSPQNPTGAVHGASELEAIADLADRHGAEVVVDEVHAPLVPEGTQFVPWLVVSDAGFSVISAAKAFNLAGLKAGLIVAGARSRKVLRQLPMSVGYGASHLGIVAHTAALLGDPAWLDDVNANIAANRRLLGALVAEQLPGVAFRQPEATYLAWLDLRATGLGADPAASLLSRGRVALTSGSGFGPGGAGHARLNFACSQALIREGVARIAEVLTSGPAAQPSSTT